MTAKVLTASLLIEILTALPNKDIPVLIACKSNEGLYTKNIIKSGVGFIDNQEVFCLQMFEGAAINVN